MGLSFETMFVNPKHREWAKMSMCVGGIVGSLVLYGVLQERIMTRPYGDEEEHFKYSVFLVLNNRVISMLTAAMVLAIRGGQVTPGAPLYKYAAVSFSNVIATTCQYEALKYVSFPLQTLGKCAKMIPVMIWGKFISNKKYGLQDYGVAAAVTLGCTLFLLYGDISSSSAKKHSSSKDTSMYGILLMCGYLGFDGFTSTFQSKLFEGYKMETYNQMLWVTFCSACISMFWLLGDSSLGAAIAFVSKYPSAMSDIFTLSLSSTLGQLFILYTIREYGALLFATIMTSRQFISILLSCVLFLHPLTLGQWTGTLMVFGALYYKTLFKSPSSHGPPKAEPEEEQGTLLTKDPEAGRG